MFIGLFYMLRTNLRPDICPQVQAAFSSPTALTCRRAAAQTTYCTTLLTRTSTTGAGFLFIPDLTNKATGAVLVA